MARDCFVYWDATPSAPTKEELRIALEEYALGIAVSIQWVEKSGRFFVQLPGFFERYNVTERRYFEVYIGDKNIDVITRQMDAITNAIAFGFAEMIAYKWKGRLERG